MYIHKNRCLLYKESCQRMSKLGCSWPQTSESYNEDLLEGSIQLRIAKQVWSSEPWRFGNTLSYFSKSPYSPISVTQNTCQCSLRPLDKKEVVCKETARQAARL